MIPNSLVTDGGIFFSLFRWSVEASPTWNLSFLARNWVLEAYEAHYWLTARQNEDRMGDSMTGLSRLKPSGDAT